ncbi:hypothetical protein DY000_02009522, partial [Brassica cretica]
FSGKFTWESLQPRGQVQEWADFVWFKGSKTSHAFMMWIAQTNILPTRTHLVLWGYSDCRLLLHMQPLPEKQRSLCLCIAILVKNLDYGDQTSRFCSLSLPHLDSFGFLDWCKRQQMSFHFAQARLPKPQSTNSGL